jgi:hypothetical protein
VRNKLRISHTEIADLITGPDHAAALRAAEEAMQADEMARITDNEREIVNYNYWTLRCQIEPDDDTLEARKAMYDGDRAFGKADLLKTNELYVQGLKKWRTVLDRYPGMLKDTNLVEDLVASIGHYRNNLRQMSEDFPDSFILQDVVDADVAAKAPNVPISKPRTADDASPAANDPTKSAP